MTAANDGSGREKPLVHKPLKSPSLKSATARRMRYDKPHRFFELGREYFEDEVIEIDVETDADFATMGTGPALFVGKTALLDSKQLGERHYRFFAPGSMALREKLSITLGTGGSGAPVAGRGSRVQLQWDATASTSSNVRPTPLPR
jgi:hypothetical protein